MSNNERSEGAALQFQNNFDLEEFLAYLLPGAVYLSAVLLAFPVELQSLKNTYSSIAPDLAVGFVFTLVFLAISLLFGHIFSVISRFVWRNILHLVFDDPELMIFKNNHKVITQSIKIKIDEKFQALFSLDPKKEDVKASFPKIVRSYVLLNSEKSAEIRKVTVRSRLMCANFMTPIVLILLSSPSFMKVQHYFAAILILILLFVRQYYLDTREARELYLAFLALPMPK